MCSAAKKNSDFPQPSESAPEVLIIGCGYLGRELAKNYLAAGYAVTATTRSGHLAAGLADGLAARCRVLALDLRDPVSIAAFAQVLGDGAPAAVHLLVPPGPEPYRVLLEAPARLLHIDPIAAARRIVIASSTAVYGDAAGEWVSADTPAVASDERGRLLLAGEVAWLAHPAARVLRLAGLYGPGRLIGAADLRRGSPLLGDPDRWLNLIHVADAAALLAMMAVGTDGARVELGCDDTPARRGDWYAGLAAALGLPAPTFDGLTRSDGPRSARAASRRCDNRPTCQRTGWRPRHSDWRSGLAASLDGNAFSGD